MTAAAPIPAVRFLARKPRPGDESFLYNAFLKSFRESDYTEGIPNTDFYFVYKREWAEVLRTFDVLIMHPEGDEDEIAGFIAWKRRTVAWLYVKKTPWRRMGVARQLLAAAGFLPGRPLQALFGSSWALSRARAAGYSVTLVPHVEAVRMLLGAG